MILKFKIFHILIITIFLNFILGSCNTRISKHGTFFSEEEINIIKKTTLNKSEIIEILGQPSTKSTFSDDVWYYISNIQKERAYFKTKTASNAILKITFDKNQQVSNYNISSKEKLLNIDINKSKTSKGIDKELGFWQDFLSSFARRLQDPAGNY